MCSLRERDRIVLKSLKSLMNDVLNANLVNDVLNVVSYQLPIMNTQFSLTIEHWSLPIDY